MKLKLGFTKRKKRNILILATIFISLFMIITIAFYFGYEPKTFDLSYSNWSHSKNTDELQFISYEGGVRVIDLDEVNVAYGQFNFIQLKYAQFEFKIKTLDLDNNGFISISFRQESTVIFRVYRQNGVYYLDLEGRSPIEMYNDLNWHTMDAKWSFITNQISFGVDGDPIVDIVPLSELSYINNIRIDTNSIEHSSITDFQFIFLKNLER